MAKYNDLVGQKFGRLTVIEHINAKDIGKSGTAAYWRCKCECGKETVVRTHDLIHDKIKSCGCYKAEAMRNTKRAIREKEIASLEKFRAHLCAKYEKKCFTNPMGKCPLANDECWNFMTFNAMYNSRNADAKKELMRHVTKALEEENYTL